MERGTAAKGAGPGEKCARCPGDSGRERPATRAPRPVLSLRAPRDTASLGGRGQSWGGIGCFGWSRPRRAAWGGFSEVL